MTSAERVRIQLGLCPSPGQTKAITYIRPSVEIRYTTIDENRIKISIPLIKVGRQASDLVCRIALCPVYMQCACSYEATLGWLILEDCAANLFWQWPEAAG